MTPRQFVLLAKWRRREVMRQEFGPALICSMIAAITGVKRTPYDFMPSMIGKQQRRTQSWEEQLQHIKELHASLGGADGHGEGR